MSFRIEVCGGIASGKTTFATLFEGAATVVYENFQAVPFWKDFYAAPTDNAFETELSFLLQHYHQVKRAQSKSQNVVVCDFSFALDAAYAHVSLNRGDLKAFLGVLEQVREHLGPPQLLVALNCPAETEMSRIHARGRATESRINLAFLENLNTVIEPERQRLAQSIPILEVDSAEQDFAHDSDVKKKLLQMVFSEIAILNTTRGGLLSTHHLHEG